MKNDLKLLSIGWSLENSAGGIPGKKIPISASSPLEKSDIFSKTFKNFGRLDKMSKAVCTAVAFALQGVGLYPIEDKKNISLLFHNKTGCADSDKAYFNDFIEFGETAGRANLFLYTLPTSPLGEASVHFGLTGDVAYFSSTSEPLTKMLATVSTSFEVNETKDNNLTLVGLGEIKNNIAEAVFMLVSKNGQSIPEGNSVLNNITNFDTLRKFISGEILK